MIDLESPQEKLSNTYLESYFTVVGYLLAQGYEGEINDTLKAKVYRMLMAGAKEKDVIDILKAN